MWVVVGVAQRNEYRGKRLSQKLAKLQSKYPQVEIEVWYENELILGAPPKAPRVWTQLGKLFNRVLTDIFTIIWPQSK